MKTKQPSEKKIKPVRMQYLRSKTQFSNMGVILERKKWDDGKESVIICHIPYCGMNGKTAKRLGEWLLKQAAMFSTLKPNKPKPRVSKYDDKIFWDTKKRELIRLKWDHAVEGSARWWWSNCHNRHGYIKGKLKTPKHWILLGTVQEGLM